MGATQEHCRTSTGAGGRQTKVIALLGKRRCGKTTLLRQIINNLVANGDRALFIAPTLTEWSDVELIKIKGPEDLDFTGIRRTLAGEFNIKELLHHLEHFQRGIIIFDDSNSYIRQHTDITLKKTLGALAHFQVDLFLTAHGFDLLPPAFFNYIEKFILFKTQSTPAGRKRFLSNYAEICRAKEVVDKHKDPHFYMLVNN